jgi:hypothetical protein
MNEQDKADALTSNLIQKWQGGYACVWEYTVSLGRLAIRITKEGQEGNLHIICLSCSHICGPFDWEHGSFEVIKTKADNVTKRYVLKDAKNGFELQCGLLSAIENVEPFY